MVGENLDISEGHEAEKPRKPEKQRRFVGITFACCDVYARIYINREETAYEGRCPRCFKPICINIGPGGTDSRFFTAY